MDILHSLSQSPVGLKLEFVVNEKKKLFSSYTRFLISNNKRERTHTIIQIGTVVMVDNIQHPERGILIHYPTIEDAQQALSNIFSI